MIEAIGTVYDPEIPVNIYELGLIYAIDLDDDGSVKVEMTLTAPGCPSAQELPVQVREALMAVPGVTDARGRGGLGSALGPEPDVRRGPPFAEHVLSSIAHEHDDRRTPNPPRLAAADDAYRCRRRAAAEAVRRRPGRDAAAHRRQDQGLLRHVLRHELGRGPRPGR